MKPFKMIKFPETLKSVVVDVKESSHIFESENADKGRDNISSILKCLNP